MAEPPVPPRVNPEVPSPARLYDYYLGGRINYRADRDAAERIRAGLPEISDMAWANRGFHQRAAKWLAESRGIAQFIDIGSGLPTQGNTHEVVGAVTPLARVVYVDNDPMVRAHAGELLTGRFTTFVFGDLRDPDAVLGDRLLRSLIDFTEPVALLMTAVMHFVADDADPWGLVSRYVAALPSGSYLALSHVTADNVPPQAVRAGLAEYAGRRRTSTCVPGPRWRVSSPAWTWFRPGPARRPGWSSWANGGPEDPETADSDGSHWGYAGVARVP